MSDNQKNKQPQKQIPSPRKDELGVIPPKNVIPPVKPKRK